MAGNIFYDTQTPQEATYNTQQQNPWGDLNWSDIASSGESSSESSSWSGLPDWASQWTKQWWPNFTKWGSQQYTDWQKQVNDKGNLGGLNTQNQSQLAKLLGQVGSTYNTNMGRMRSDFQNSTGGLQSYIDQATKLMPQQYLNQMSLYNERATQPVLNRLSSRGILNSSVTGDALSDVLRDTQAKYGDEVTKANLWGAQTGYDMNKYLSDQLLGINKYQTDTGIDLGKYGTGMQNELMRYFTDKNLGMDEEQRKNLYNMSLAGLNSVPQLLAAMRESQSKSKSSGSQYGGLLELLLGGV